ncbi:MAG: sigma 54-interacting transcriptional regulator [Pirellulaceae bacterium]
MADSTTRPSAYDDVCEGLLQQLSMGRSFDELFESIYDQLRETVPYHRIGVGLLEGPERVLRLTYCRSDGDLAMKVGYAAHIEGSTLEPLLESGRPRIINDLERYFQQKPTSASTELILREGMRSSLTLPLVAEGKPIGVVFFSSREAGVYNDQHLALLKRLAGHVGISLERTRLITALREKNEELANANQIKDGYLELQREEVNRRTAELRKSEERYRLLVRLGRSVNSSLELRQVFEYAAEQIHTLFECDRISLLLVADYATTRHGFGLEFEQGKRWTDIPHLPLAGSGVQWVMERRVPRVSRSLEDHRQFPEDHRLFDQGYRSYVHLPLVCRDQSLGVLGMASKRVHAPDGWDLELLAELSDQLAIALDNAAAYEEIARLKTQLEEQNIYLRDEIKTDHDFGNIVGDSRAMWQVRQSIQQVATTDSTVLVLGETGTGKELVARAIHDLSRRRDNLLVKVNCAALAPSLITSELFGHEAGAFTGAAKRRVGRFELAHEGSIFLDEISEVPAETQVMLLRVLQERTIERVGGSASIEVNTRVIAATNRDLKAYADEGHFRDDLYYRLHVFPIRVPPLRDRREDIPALIHHFIGRFSRRMNKDISRVDRRTMELLLSYDWPGNVRELENIIERAMIVSPSATLEIDPTWLAAVHDPRQGHPPAQTLAEVERNTILDTLHAADGKVYGPDGAAARLGLKPTTLYGKMRKHSIARKRGQFEPS